MNIVRDETVVNEYWMYEGEPFRVRYVVYEDGSRECRPMNDGDPHSLGMNAKNKKFKGELSRLGRGLP